MIYMRALVSSGTCSGARGNDSHVARTQMVASCFSRHFSLSGVDRLCANRAPGASTYIRQLHDGLPQSCMHSADDRGDGVTLFAGARDANRILEQPVAPLPDPAGPEALKSRRGLRCGGHVWRGLSHDGAVGYQARFDIAPERDRQLASQGNQHDAPDPRRLIRGLAGIPVRQGTAGLVFPPEPCDFNEDASCPTVAGLGDPLAPGRRAAVVGARCQPKVGAELSAAGEGSREDLARQDRCTGATHPLQSAQQFSLPLDRWILRIGGIALLLDNAKLALDQLKTLVFPFKFTTQAFGKRPALGGGQLAEINSSAPPLRLDPPNALGEE